MAIFSLKKINGFVSKTQNRVGCPCDYGKVAKKLKPLVHYALACGLPSLTGLLSADSQSLERLAIGHMLPRVGAQSPTVKNFASPYPLVLQTRYIRRG
jgi:hypothetical protein